MNQRTAILSPLSRAILFALAGMAAIPASADYILRSPPQFSGTAAPAPALTYNLAAFSPVNAPVSASGYDFGNVPLTESREGFIRVTNQGTGAVTLSSATLSGDASITSTSGAQPCGAGVTLNPGTSCYAYIGFAPSAPGTVSASFNVAGNHGASTSVSVAGTGVASTVNLNAYDNLNRALVGAVTYGSEYVNETASVTHTGKIINSGSGTAVLSTRTLGGSSAFSLLTSGGDANCSVVTSLAPGQYCNVYASFTPVAVGQVTATYTLATTGGQTVSMAMTGEGLAPIAPTLSGFELPNLAAGNTFTIVQPYSSNTTGTWTYSSSNTAVATIDGNVITAIGGGVATITASQAASGHYTSASITAGLTVTAAACSGGKQVFEATGGDQFVTVPAGCSIATVKAWGAGGGTGNNSLSAGGGGFAQRNIGTTPGETILVVVGKGGTSALSPASYGYGGKGGVSGNVGANGGGLSGVFRGTASRANALVIAGGGGGASTYAGGGAGGGSAGQSGGYGAAGGTQSAGGAVELTGDSNATDAYYGGGGGGYFGGGIAYLSGGGGGSGYAPGGVLTTGSGRLVANSSDADYVAGRGNGGIGSYQIGQDGVVVIIWQ